MADDNSAPTSGVYYDGGQLKVPTERGRPPLDPRQLHHILSALGDVVYAIRTKEGWIKIGHTTNLATRRRHYSSKPTDLLGFFRGTYDDEQDIHATLVPYRAKGHEYYHPTPEVLAVVNDMREALGLSMIAA